MHWGRQKYTDQPEKPSDLSRGARAVILTGTLICALFFVTESSASHQEILYPTSMAEAAQTAFHRDHAVLAAALGLDTEEALPAGSFGMADGERWTFSRYLQDAFRFLLQGGEG